MSWIELNRWNQLTTRQQDGFPPIAPDFVIELVSPSERCDPASTKAVATPVVSRRKGTPTKTDARERALRLKNQRYSDLQLKMQ